MNTTVSAEGPHHAVTHRVDVKPGSLEDYTSQVRDFLRAQGIGFVLAFSGGADDRSPALEVFSDLLSKDERIPKGVRSELTKLAESASHAGISRIVSDILERLRGYRIAVLTGGTHWGVPDAATKVAKQLGFPTIGVYPLLAEGKSALSPDLLDLAVCVHPFVGDSAWGDESHIFTKLLDGVIVIGGNAGTMTEVAHLLKLNEKKADLLGRQRELEVQEESDTVNAALRQVRDKLSQCKLRPIIPIYGSGGTADRVLTFPGKPHTMAFSIPSHPITSGASAVRYLVDHVLSEDIFEPERT